MKAHRTEASYDFASCQLLPAGVIVFFSDTLRRYVHPIDGVLFDAHPRLESLSETESQQLSLRWSEALAT